MRGLTDAGNAKLLRDEDGQTTVEYILLLSIVVSFFFVVNAGLRKINATQKLMAPLNDGFAKAYKYGHPKAVGFDEGAPSMHPRIDQPGNFRIFINPRNQ